MTTAYDALPDCDWAETTTIRCPGAATVDSAAWAREIFATGSAPVAVRALMAAREVVAHALRLPPGDRSMLRVSRMEGDEAVIDTDDVHLRFVATVRTDPARGLVHLVTVVRFKGWRGRLYFVPVRFLHDPISRAMMTRAARRLEAPAAP